MKQRRTDGHAPPHPDLADLVTALGQGRKSANGTQERYGGEGAEGWIFLPGNAECRRGN